MIISSFVVYGIPDEETSGELTEALQDWFAELARINGLDLNVSFITQKDKEEQCWEEFNSYLNNK